MRKLGAIALVLTMPTLACNKPDTAPSASSAAPTSPPQTASTTAPPKAEAPAQGKATVGQPAPDFELTGLDGAKASLSDSKGKIVVLEWFNPDCPYVKAAHGKGTLNGMAKKMKEKYGDRLVWLAVNSGAEGRQGHGDETNRAGKEKFGIDYPVLYDPSGKVGRAYGATNTPHMFVIDEKGTLVYAGALDNTGSGDPEDAEPELVNFVSNALEDVSAGKPVRKSQTRAWGCSVKYANN